MRRKLTEQEENAAAAQALRGMSAADRTNLMQAAGLTAEEAAEVSEQVGFEGEL